MKASCQPRRKCRSKSFFSYHNSILQKVKICLYSAAFLLPFFFILHECYLDRIGQTPQLILNWLSFKPQTQSTSIHSGKNLMIRSSVFQRWWGEDHKSFCIFCFINLTEKKETTPNSLHSYSHRIISWGQSRSGHLALERNYVTSILLTLLSLPLFRQWPSFSGTGTM